MIIEHVVQGFVDIIQLHNLLFLLIGTVLGLIVGGLPGLSSPMAMIVLLPITYSMNTLSAMVMLMGIYMSTKLGGSFTAILIRIPGTPAGACSMLDGYPMTLNGRGSEALGYSTIAAVCGGILGWCVAIVLVPVIGSIAKQTTNADIALIAVAGLILVATMMPGSTFKSWIGALIGLFFGTVGLDPVTAVSRYTLGSFNLMAGIPFMTALIGLFGYTVILGDVDKLDSGIQPIRKGTSIKLPGILAIIKQRMSIAIGSAFGIFVGMVPGVGATTSTWIAYGFAKKRSKTPERYGTGIPEGVVVSETAATSDIGGALIPMLTLGIPGDGSTAVLLGALILHNIQPGVMLVSTEPELVYGILASALLAVFFMFIVARLSIRYFVFLFSQRRAIIYPFILVLISIGAFASSNTAFSIYLAIFFGVIGFFLESRGYSVIPIVLGIILGPIIEQNSRLALSLSQGDWSTFVSGWPEVTMVVLICILIANEMRIGLKRRNERLRHTAEK